MPSVSSALLIAAWYGFSSSSDKPYVWSFASAAAFFVSKTLSSPSRLSIASSSAELTLVRSAADLPKSVRASCALLSAVSKAFFGSADAYWYASFFSISVASLIFVPSAALAVWASADAASTAFASSTALFISSIVVAFFTRSTYGLRTWRVRWLSALMVVVASFFAASSVVVMSVTGTTCVFIPGTLIRTFVPFCTTVARSISVFTLFTSVMSLFNASINPGLYSLRIACFSGSVKLFWLLTGTWVLGVSTVTSFTNFAIVCKGSS